MNKMIALSIIVLALGVSACNKQQAAAPMQTPAVTEQVATPAASEPATAVVEDAAAAVAAAVEPIANQVESAISK